VRFTHQRTGISGESRSERSQHRNDAVALRLLKARLFRVEEQMSWPAERRPYDDKGEMIRSHQVRSYVLQPYTLARDARTGTETSQVQEVLDGDLDLFLRAYING
jgi:peptide chain release factor 2